MHRRQVTANGYEREDGLWDIEAEITDVKSAPVENSERGGYVAPGEPFHYMRMRFTIDKAFLIHEVEAVTEASPFRICPSAARIFKRLEGTRIGPGWQRLAKERLSGPEGCTHLFELLPVLATTAIQSLWPSLDKGPMEAGAHFLLNSCLAWSESSEVVKRELPHLYNPIDRQEK